MSQLTKQVNTQAATWTTLSALMIAAGYTGTNALTHLQIINKNATPVYIHLTNNGTTPPATANYGIPIGTAEASIEWTFEQAAGEFLDAGTTWLHCADVQAIKIAAIGGGI